MHRFGIVVFRYLVFGLVILGQFSLGGCNAFQTKASRVDTNQTNVNQKNRNQTDADQKEIRISLVGDIMLSRAVQEYLDAYGYDYPYENVKGILWEDDISIGNLECPITNQTSNANKSKRFLFKADIENAAALKRAGFDVLNLANNHTMDYLSEGLEDTMLHLEGAGLDYFGIARKNEEKYSYIFEKDSVRVGFLAYSNFPAEGYFYNENKVDIQYISGMDLDKLEEDLNNMQADVKIVYFHWGIEFEKYRSDRQAQLAHFAIDAGADFVLGTHPHVIQNHEMYKNKHIYYSLGNFVFDKQIPHGTDRGLMLLLSVDKEGIKDVKEVEYKIEKARVELPDK